MASRIAHPVRAEPPPAPGASSDQFMTALATEHFTLQTARASTIAEAGARSTLFMSTVSSFVVALAFVGTVSETGSSFDLFALALLPVLFLLGLLTYARLSASAIEDAFYGRSINRIRRYYREVDPDRAAYLSQSDRDDLAGVMASAGQPMSVWHLLSHTATMVLVVTAVIAGAGGALLVDFAAGVSSGTAAAVGAITAIAVAALMLGHEVRAWRRAEERSLSLFPSRL